MKKVLTIAAMLCIATFHAHYAYSQDTSRIQHSKTTDDEDEDTPAERPQKQKAVSKRIEAPVTVGLVGGLNQAALIVGGNGSGGVNGILFGGMLDVRLGGVAHFETGLHYVMTGGSGLYLTSGVTATWRVNTIELPVIFQFKFGRPGRNHFYIGAGGYAAYNVSGTSSASGYSSASMDIGSDNKAVLKTFDAGIIFDIGYQLKYGLFFRLKGQGGLTDLQPQTGLATIRSSASSLEIGYLFGAPRKAHRHGVRRDGNRDIEMKM